MNVNKLITLDLKKDVSNIDKGRRRTVASGSVKIRQERNLGVNLNKNLAIEDAKDSSNSTGNINVVLRCRPLNKKELEMASDICLDFTNGNTVSIKSTSENNTYNFSFDRVFDYNTNQHEIFDFAAKNIVDSVLEGFNGTIFAYGQTSSGKTFTMQGVINDPALEGIIPRLTRYLFERIAQSEKSDSNIEYVIKASIIEIYNEKIRDLLDTSKINLQVREDKVKGIFIEDLTEHLVNSAQKILGVIQKGLFNRAINSTNMNEQSSRSHSIVVVNITQNNLKDLSAKSGKLYLVDLAGSEKISKTGATGVVLDEAKMINKSLTSLGQVIKALTEAKNVHVPYRDSKLTRVLQESLGGNSKTCLIITCSPAAFNESETLSTLRFGLRAKKVKNKAKVNKDYSIQELKQEVNKLEGQLGQFKSRVDILEEYLIKNGLSLPGQEDDSEVSEGPQIAQAVNQDPHQSIILNKNPKHLNSSHMSNMSVMSEQHILEINNKFVEVLDIVNDLEIEKVELQEQLKKASERMNQMHINDDKKESFAQEIQEMKSISDLRASEYEKEVNKMKRYMEKNKHNLTLISEANIDLEVNPESSPRESKKRETSENKNVFNLLQMEEIPEILLEFSGQKDEDKNLGEIEEKTTTNHNLKDKDHSSNGDKEEDMHLLTTNPFTIGNNLDLNTNSADFISGNSKMHTNTPDYSDNMINIGHKKGVNNEEVIDELLDKLKEYGNKVPEINKLIENFKDRFHKHEPKQELSINSNQPQGNIINNYSPMFLDNKLSQVSISASVGSFSYENELSKDRLKKIDEVEKNNILTALENKVDKLFDYHLKEKYKAKSAVKNENFVNWNLKCWKEKYKNLGQVKK